MTQDLDSLYQEIILDHYKHPHGRGLRDAEDPADRVAEAHHVNPTCGDEVTVRVATDGTVLHDISYDGMGCSISQASASMMSDLVEGKTVSEIRGLTDEFQHMMKEPDVPAPESLGDLEALQGVVKFPVRIKCATLPWNTLTNALDEVEAKAS